MILTSLIDIIRHTREVHSSWNTTQKPWFRGEPESGTPVLPKLFRKSWQKTEHQIVQEFRSKGPVYGLNPIPRENNNEWLFLMQHTGAPTRLLDWCEGLMVALFFALHEENPILWMMNPNQLNRIAGLVLPENNYPICWGNEASPAHKNIQAPFREGQGAIEYPIAFIPTYIHPRMASQKSVFTVHGSKPISLASIDGFSQIEKISISPDHRHDVLDELDFCGISYSSIFPDYDGLGKEYGT
ncbi:MAG: FRG domain-containing protein [Thermotogota bacterium]|nr:FRG domain-containing protein [Thermotogota bacterium]